MKMTKAPAAVVAAALVLTGCTSGKNISGASDVSEKISASEEAGSS